MTFGFLFIPVQPAYPAFVSESISYRFSDERQTSPACPLRTAAERRQARRFALEIPVLFRWVDNGQTACEGAGFCRDISTRGVFVVASAGAPPLGCKLDLMVLLPALNPRGPALRLHSTGSVVRVEHMGDEVGVGIFCRFGHFEDSDRLASSTLQENVPFPCS